MPFAANKMPPPPPLDIRGASVPAADLSFANLEDADLSNANAKNAKFVGSNLKNTNFNGTNLVGADLSDARNLTVEQLSSAILDSTTKLPSYIDPAAVGLQPSAS